MSLLFSNMVIAQEYHFSGTILDKETGTGIPNANISIVGTSQGCISSSNGEFSIKSDTLPVNMIISHVGYKSRRIWLENDPAPFTVLMEASVQTLKEVEIIDKNKPYPFFKDSKYAVLDYQADQDLIYLLIYRFNLSRSELLCKSFYGDTIVPSYVLPFKPAELFMDCLGYMHVLSRDSAYQVYLGKDSLRLIHHHSIEKFMATLENCAASTESALYFRNESRDHQVVEFYMIDRDSYKKTYISSVRDDMKLKMLYKNPLDMYYACTDTFPDSFQGMAEWMWVNQILYTPNESTLIKIGDTLCIFSTVDGTLELTGLDGQFLGERKMPVVEKSSGNWTKEIYVDQVTGIPYTAFEKYGKVMLYRIDLPTGNIEHVATTFHTFPQRISVHHDHLFYIYDTPGEGDNKHLFKQKL